MKAYKKKLKLKRKYKIMLIMIIVSILSISIARLIAWRIEQIDNYPKKHESIKIFK